VTLAEKLSSRGNAVTLLRLGAAALVVFGHAWDLSGHGPDPLHRLLGEPYRSGGVNLAGELGVNTFFALSGYLVTQSWLRARSAGDFATKRFRRIMPGYWVCLLLTGLLLFPWLWARQHATGLAAAWSESPALDYVWKNFLLRIRAASFGDLFAAQPAAGVANGALWSLFPEALCYVGVALGGALLAYTRRMPLLWLAAAGLFVAHVAGPWLLPRLEPQLAAKLWYPWRLVTQATFFAAGMLWCVRGGGWRPRAGHVLGAAALLAPACALGGYLVAGPVLLPFVALSAAALLPGESLERLGDISYGTYLYHYPIQQALVAYGIALASPWLFLAASLALTVPVAAASWFLIEKPALRWGAPRRPVIAPAT